MSTEKLSYDELHEVWPLLVAADRAEGFLLLERTEAEDLFETLDAREQAELIRALPSGRRRVWVRLLAPDDAADVIQETVEEEDRKALLDMLDEPVRKEVLALLAYDEDEAGGLMNPRFARLRPDMTADAAISYLRRQKVEYLETIYYAYVLNKQQHLEGVVSLRDLVTSAPGKLISEIMETDIISARENTDQEALVPLFEEHDLAVLPVLDDQGCMKGIVTVDDIVDVIQEEATEDMHKIGGAAALEAPYLEVNLRGMLQKRAGWLAMFILLGFLSVLALKGFEAQIEKWAVLILFLPLIIASGGNSGTQASSLVVRAMALDEFRLCDWWRVLRRELSVGLSLGVILGAVGFTTTWVYLNIAGVETALSYVMIAFTVAISIVGVALWGTIAGSMLPFILSGFGCDPAAASAPLVATLVDASGLVIYLGIAGVILSRAML